jgi:hypothetical protein
MTATPKLPMALQIEVRRGAYPGVLERAAVNRIED